HSILAMSGEETLAQVYREVESPKLPNFKKAAFVVFLYSFLLTGTMNFLAVLLIPDHLRMKEYYDNWMGGLAMQMIGPPTVLLLPLSSPPSSSASVCGFYRVSPTPRSSAPPAASAAWGRPASFRFCF